MSMTVIDCPTETKSETFKTPSGQTMEVLESKRATGAWLKLPGKDRCLSVQDTVPGSHRQLYAGYRDGIQKKSDKLAIVVDGDEVSLFIAIGSSESPKYRTISLKQLEAIVLALMPEAV